MSTVIKASENQATTPGAAFNLNDVAAQANRYLAEVQAKRDQMLAEAEQQAQQIREQAEQSGRQAAMQAVDQLVQDRVADEMKTLKPALTNVLDQMEQLKQQWQIDWQNRAIHVAIAVAEKILHGELDQRPDVSQKLVADALQLAVGSREIRIRLNPQDHAMLDDSATELATVVSKMSPTEIIADETVAPGGCRIETQHGAIDATLQAQLNRIEQELKQ